MTETALAEPVVRDLGDGTSLVSFETADPKELRLVAGILEEAQLNARRAQYPPAADVAPGKARVFDTAPAGLPMAIRFVPDREVPAKHRAFCRKHIDAVAARLGIAAPIRVRYFLPCAPEDGEIVLMSGGHDRATAAFTPDDSFDTFHLQASLRGPIVAAAIAHEVRHLHQNRLIALVTDKLHRELDAERFAARYMAEAG